MISFNKNAIPVMSSLKIEIYNGETLELYQFGDRNHVLKFEIECSIDKFNTNHNKQYVPFFKDLPPPVDYHTPFRFSKENIHLIIIILLIGGLVILITSNSIQPRPAQPVAV